MPLKFKGDDSPQPFTNIRVSDTQVILAVDDVPANFAAITNLLPESYEISIAKSAKEALEILAHSFVDLILLDIEMPVMSGIEMFEEMRKNPDYKSIPVIFVTSDKDSDTVKKVVSMGAKGYIVKPFDSKTVLDKMHRVLAAASQDQAALFLQRKIKTVIDCCGSGNVSLAENTMKELPKNVYSKYVFLKLNRVISALHNRDFNQAMEIAKEIMRGL